MPEHPVTPTVGGGGVSLTPSIPNSGNGVVRSFVIPVSWLKVIFSGANKPCFFHTLIVGFPNGCLLGPEVDSSTKGVGSVVMFVAKRPSIALVAMLFLLESLPQQSICGFSVPLATVLRLASKSRQRCFPRGPARLAWSLESPIAPLWKSCENLIGLGVSQADRHLLSDRS